jgi:hypothetical protein
MTSTYQVGGELEFRFEGFPAALAARIDEFLSYFRAASSPTGSSDLHLSYGPYPESRGQEALLLDHREVEVRASGELLVFETAKAIGWCRPERGDGGFELLEDTADACSRVTHLLLAPVMFELARPRGWWGVHAAAISIRGQGLLLPGPTGSGKSTIFTSALAGGLQVLADDLVWVRPEAGGARLFAFPRGAPDLEVHEPTADDVPLRAIVCPRLVSSDESAVSPLPTAEVLEVLLAQSNSLVPGPSAAQRFRLLVRIAASVPGFRLELGHAWNRVPRLLEQLVTAAAEPKLHASNVQEDDSDPVEDSRPA